MKKEKKGKCWNDQTGNEGGSSVERKRREQAFARGEGSAGDGVREEQLGTVGAEPGGGTGG